MARTKQEGRGSDLLGTRSSGSCEYPSTDAFEAQLVQIYNLYRDALLSKVYYTARLRDLHRKNTLSEIILSVGTGSFGSLAIWQGAAGKHVFVFLAAFSALLSILKPIMQWPKQIAACSKLAVAYTALYMDLRQIVQEIETREAITPELLNAFRLARNRFGNLALEEPTPIERIVRNCYAEVLTMIPVDSLWMPQRNGVPI